jgi:endonuclease III
MNKAETVAGYIRNHPTFMIVDSMERYHHMGATLADAVLQRGIDYKSVVETRIKRLLAAYPAATKTSAFARIVTEQGAAQVLNWSEGQKPHTLTALINLLLEDGVETEDELKAWLERPGNIRLLQRIKGIKDKTADYLQILVGIQTLAVDMHLFAFLAEAGVSTSNYAEAHKILRETAALIGVEPAKLDHSIWRYRSERPAKRRGAKLCQRKQFNPDESKN